MALEILESPLKVRSSLPKGYKVRAGTLEDIPAVVKMLNDCSQHYFKRDRFTIEDTLSEWTQPGFVLEDSTRIIFAPDGSVAAMMEVWDLDNPPVRVSTWARVHPDHEGLGLGTYLLAWGEQRSQQSAERCPAEVKVSQFVTTHAGYEPSKKLFLDRGFHYNRSFYTMRIDMNEAPPSPKLTDGIIIRAANMPEEFTDIIQTVHESFKDHWGHVDTPFEEELAHWQHEVDSDPEHDNDLWFVAIDQKMGKIAGVNLCRSKGWSDFDMAWVSDLAVRREYRKHGLGLALLHHAFGEFWRRGLPSVGLGVDASNLTGALRLYERAGMHVYQQRDTYEKVVRDGVDLMITQLES